MPSSFTPSRSISSVVVAPPGVSASSRPVSTAAPARCSRMAAAPSRFARSRARGSPDRTTFHSARGLTRFGIVGGSPSGGRTAPLSPLVDRDARVCCVRTDPPETGPELAQLNAYLDVQREAILRKTEGLTREQLGRPHPPSTLTL